MDIECHTKAKRCGSFNVQYCKTYLTLSYSQTILKKTNLEAMPKSKKPRHQESTEKQKKLIAKQATETPPTSTEPNDGFWNGTDYHDQAAGIIIK